MCHLLIRSSVIRKSSRYIKLILPLLSFFDASFYGIFRYTEYIIPSRSIPVISRLYSKPEKRQEDPNYKKVIHDLRRPPKHKHAFTNTVRRCLRSEMEFSPRFLANSRDHTDSLGMFPGWIGPRGSRLKRATFDGWTGPVN